MHIKPKEGNKFQEILKNENLVLVDFFADWCGPCQMMKPILADVKSKMGDKIRILKVDVDKNPDAAQTWKVQSIPTLALFKKGKMVWRQTGIMQAAPLIQMINQHAKSES